MKLDNLNLGVYKQKGPTGLREGVKNLIVNSPETGGVGQPPIRN